MAFAFQGAAALDYAPCHYGASRLVFRGPAREINGPLVACLGGAETYGKFVPTPWPDLLEAAIGLPVANLGCMNAGPDVYLHDKAVLQLARQAACVVVQVTGAQNLSNRYYMVHPRRNDRLVGVTPLLRSLFPRLDFTQFNYTRHLLLALQNHNSDAFEVVADELRAVWVSRMKEILGQLPSPTVLIWLAKDRPARPGRPSCLSSDPMLIDAEMIAALRPLVSNYAEILPSAEARLLGSHGMRLAPMDGPAAAQLPGPAVHAEVAMALTSVLRQLI